MVQVPKYICDASDDVPWLPKRFQDGSTIAQAYWVCDWYDGCGADTGMRQKCYRNWRTLIFQRGKLGGMGGMGSCGCGEHQRMLRKKFYITCCRSKSMRLRNMLSGSIIMFSLSVSSSGQMSGHWDSASDSTILFPGVWSSNFERYKDYHACRWFSFLASWW